MTAIHDASGLGFSVWFDNLSRKLLTSGELARMVGEGLTGVTSNPTIFEKAIDSGSDYDDAVVALVAEGLTDAKAIYERLVIDDIRAAADVLRPVYDRTNARDGFVSIEVSPHLARDTQGTLAEARRLFATIARPNVLVKIPGTAEGVPAIEQLISEGINVNITLLFAIDAYRAVADAYIAGLQRFGARGGSPVSVASVASFFLSRIDTLVDEQIGVALEGASSAAAAEQLAALRGTVAIACAKLAYREYQQMTASTRWKALARLRARTQRLLWASTSTKNPSYPKAMYVDRLIGRDTINTMPGDTYREFRDHGKPRITVTDDLAGAERTLAELAECGIAIDDVTRALLDDGIAKFVTSYDTLLGAIERKRQLVIDRSGRAGVASISKH